MDLIFRKLKEVSSFISEQLNRDFLNLKKIIKNHYLLVTSIGGLIFTLICYSYTVIFYRGFGINIFEFSDITEIYRLSANGDITTVLIATFFLLIQCYFAFLMFHNKKINYFGIAISMMLFIIYMLPIIKVIDLHEQRKNFARYDIKNKWSTDLKCVSILSSTDKFMLLWERTDDKFLAVNINNVMTVKKRLASKPEFSYKSDIAKPSLNNNVKSLLTEKSILEQKLWSSNLKNKCNLDLDPFQVN